MRRRRLHVGPSRLAAFVEKLGLASASIDDEPPRAPGAGLRPAPPLEGDTTTRRVLRSDEEAERQAPVRAGDPVAPSIYRVRRDDGTVLGPMSFPMLVELFATGAVGSTCAIALENSSAAWISAEGGLSRERVRGEPLTPTLSTQRKSGARERTVNPAPSCRS